MKNFRFTRKWFSTYPPILDKKYMYRAYGFYRLRHCCWKWSPDLLRPQTLAGWLAAGWLAAGWLLAGGWLACHVDEYLGTANNSTDSPHSLWYGRHEDPDLKVFGARVVFVHNEDRGKLDPPGHHGVFLGYCEHTDGIYVWDKESPGEPVRISRNYLGKSFHEACAVQSEPVGVSADNFEILQDEIKQLENNSYLDDTSQALPFVPPDNVPTETLLHWRTKEPSRIHFRTVWHNGKTLWQTVFKNGFCCFLSRSS